jgi:hypothetical protein
MFPVAPVMPLRAMSFVPSTQGWMGFDAAAELPGRKSHQGCDGPSPVERVSGNELQRRKHAV